MNVNNFTSVFYSAQYGVICLKCATYCHFLNGPILYVVCTMYMYSVVAHFALFKIDLFICTSRVPLLSQVIENSTHIIAPIASTQSTVISRVTSKESVYIFFQMANLYDSIYLIVTINLNT